MDDPLWPTAGEWLAAHAAEPGLAVLGVPTSAGSISRSSAWRAPGALRTILHRFASFHGESGVRLSDLPVLDVGDLPIERMDLEEALDHVEQRAAVLAREPVWAFLGGDNAITRPLVKGLAGDRLDRVGVVTFDAHHDVRILDFGPLNGTPIRGLLEDGLKGEHVVQIGIHSFANSAEYRAYCDEAGIRVVTMAEVERDGLDAALDRVLHRLAERCDWIYVDFDIDVLDRSFAPGCPGARPGGMTPRQLAAAANRCGRHAAVRAADFVEVDPTADHDDLTVMAMALVFLSFAAGVAARGARR